MTFSGAAQRMRSRLSSTSTSATKLWAKLVRLPWLAQTRICQRSAQRSRSSTERSGTWSTALRGTRWSHPASWTPACPAWVSDRKPAAPQTSPGLDCPTTGFLHSYPTSPAPALIPRPSAPATRSWPDPVWCLGVLPPFCRCNSEICALLRETCTRILDCTK